MFSFSKKFKDQKKIAKGNWYYDRYQSAITQRNFFFIIFVIIGIILLLNNFAIKDITLNRDVKPFVVEIKKSSGITTYVRPYPPKVRSFDDSLKEYFVNKYIKARESYNYYIREEQRDIVRILSTQDIYDEYKKSFFSNSVNNWSRMSSKGSVKINIVSMIKLDITQTKLKNKQKAAPDEYLYQVRFTQRLEYGNEVKNFKKVALLTFKLDDLETNKKQSLINPIGFQITSYEVNDDNL